jgi:hypothetical protein
MRWPVLKKINVCYDALFNHVSVHDRAPLPPDE